MRIVCTFLPVYVFTLNVTQDVPGVRVELLINANVGCPHDYSLRPDDLRAVANADVIVTNGLGLDPFIDQLRQAAPRARVISISDKCDVIEEAGHHDHEHEGHDHDAHEGHDHASHEGHEEAVNPHVWVSPTQATRQVTTLATKLAVIDPAHRDVYQRNVKRYMKDQLVPLAMKCSQLASALAERNRRIVTFHDAFAYLARDLNLEVVATLTQDPEHAPSAAQIAETVQLIREKKPAAIFFEPAYSDRLARTISRETGVPLHPLNPFNSMEGTPTKDSYDQVMNENLATLARALGESP